MNAISADEIFIRKGAAGVGASALLGLGVEEVEAQGRGQKWDMSADFVTFDAGTSDLAGACRDSATAPSSSWSKRTSTSVVTACEREKHSPWRRDEPAEKVRHTGFADHVFKRPGPLRPPREPVLAIKTFTGMRTQMPRRSSF
jgi:hypothetical protein